MDHDCKRYLPQGTIDCYFFMMYCSQMRGTNPTVMLDDRKFAMLTTALPSSHGCGRCNQKEERAKESSFSVVADLPCQHRARSAELVGRSKRQRCHLSTWAPNILPERKHCHDARARVLLDALPILPATQSKVSPKGPSIYEVHLKRGKELEGSNPKAKVVVLPAQKVFALEM